MGLSDEYKVSKINCGNCNEPINEIQSKEFMCARRQYDIGDEIEMYEGSKIEKGYFQEDLYCKKCRYRGELVRPHITNNTYAGYELLTGKESWTNFMVKCFTNKYKDKQWKNSYTHTE